MTRAALALATLLTLTLNGSLASAAAQPLACTRDGVCVISLRMLAPPPHRPANLAERVAYVIPVDGRR